MKKCFKPLDNIFVFHWLYWVILVFPLDLAMLLLDFEKTITITVLVANLSITLAVGISRLIYRDHYEITDDYMIKYHGKNVVFKVKRGEIKQVLIKKASWYAPFSHAWAIWAGPLDKPHGSSISFVYESCDIRVEQKVDIPRAPLNPNKNKNLQEHVEICSLRRCKEICNYLKMSPVFIE